MFRYLINSNLMHTFLASQFVEPQKQLSDFFPGRIFCLAVDYDVGIQQYLQFSSLDMDIVSRTSKDFPWLVLITNALAASITITYVALYAWVFCKVFHVLNLHSHGISTNGWPAASGIQPEPSAGYAPDWRMSSRGGFRA